MTWLFTSPWAFAGLLAVPALVAIYWLRRRSRHRVVSSLLLWRGEPPSREGGRRFERLRPPGLFWLELAVLLLLLLAAAGPMVPTRESRRPLVVVLDDSFSMLAGDVSPRDAALRALGAEMADDSRHLSVALVLAGATPQVLQGAAGGEATLESLRRWRATSPRARLGEAVALAREVGGPRSRVLVLSDQAPPEAVGEPALEWWAFGRPLANLAIVQAVRSPAGTTEDGDACLVELANYSPANAVARLTVEAGGAASSREIEIEPEAIARYRFTVPAGREVTVSLAADPLTIDDRVVLLPEAARPVRVRLAIRDEALAQVVEDALRATERVLLTPGPADWLVTDRPSAAVAAADSAGGGAWTLHVLSERRARPYLGPFVLDSAHPLTEGLSLAGVIWASGEEAPSDGPELSGAAVISAGNVPLVLDRERSDGRHEVTLRLRPDLSTVIRTPSWPILWWNLLEWRSASAPGLRRANVRLGETVNVGLPPDTSALDLRRPGGDRVRLEVRGAVARIRADRPGIHELAVGESRERFAVNALAAEESDLRRAVEGRWGDWDGDAGDEWGYRSVAWVLLLAALALLAVHGGLTAR